MYLIRAYSYDSDLGAEVTHLWSTGGFTSRGDDTPADVSWEGRIDDPGNWEAHLFTARKTQGRSEATAGVVQLLNLDGALDGLWKHGWGRPLEIYYGPDTAKYFSEFTLLATHTTVGVDRARGVLKIAFQDLQSVIADKLMNVNEFLGTNVGASGVEGTASDLKGKKRPSLLGAVSAIPAPQVNSISLVGQISDKITTSVSVTALSDKGAPLTYNTTYGSLAALLAATTPSTKYDLYLGSSTDGAYYKLGTPPSGAVIVDAAEGANDAARTVAQILKRIFLGPCGLTTSQLDLPSFTALDALNSAVVGYWSGTEEEKVGDVLDKLCASIGAFWRVTATGKITVGLFAAPVLAEATLEITDDEFLESGFEVTVPSDFKQGIPPYKITTEYSRHFFVFGDNDFAGLLSETTKANLREEYRRIASTTISGVKTKHPGSEEYVHKTLLRDASAAATMQARLVTLYGVERELVVLPLPVSIAGSVELNDSIKITSSRFGWSAGVAFRVIGRVHEYADARVILYGWR